VAPIYRIGDAQRRIPLPVVRGEIVITSFATRSRIVPGLHLGVLRETRRLVCRRGEHVRLHTRTVTERTHDLRNALLIIRDSYFLPEHLRGRAVSETVKQIEQGLNSLLPRLEQRFSDPHSNSSENQADRMTAGVPPARFVGVLATPHAQQSWKNYWPKAPRAQSHPRKQVFVD
jgi:hypothetical protein